MQSGLKEWGGKYRGLLQGINSKDWGKPPGWFGFTRDPPGFFTWEDSHDKLSEVYSPAVMYWTGLVG